MARLREVPFGRYYGTVDATPLFVMLLGEYFRRTGDLDTVRRLWPNAMAALLWIDTAGDPDRDGFVEYDRHNATGLINQGWKDSADAIFHADGELARGRSRFARCRATYLLPNGRPRTWREHSANRPSPESSTKTPRPSGSNSSRRSGARSYRPMRWPSMATSSPAVSSRLMPGMLS